MIWMGLAKKKKKRKKGRKMGKKSNFRSVAGPQHPPRKVKLGRPNGPNRPPGPWERRPPKEKKSRPLAPPRIPGVGVGWGGAPDSYRGHDGRPALPARAGASTTPSRSCDACSGRQFDPSIVPIMIAIVEEERLAEEGVHREALDEAGIDDRPRDLLGASSRACSAASVGSAGRGSPPTSRPRPTSTSVPRPCPSGIAGGHVSFDEGTAIAPAEEISCMRRALRHLDAAIGRVSGGTLVDHFYDEALEGLSSRMRRVADELGFLAH